MATSHGQTSATPGGTASTPTRSGEFGLHAIHLLPRGHDAAGALEHTSLSRTLRPLGPARCDERSPTCPERRLVCEPTPELNPIPVICGLRQDNSDRNSRRRHHRDVHTLPRSCPSNCANIPCPGRRRPAPPPPPPVRRTRWPNREDRGPHRGPTSIGCPPDVFVNRTRGRYPDPVVHVPRLGHCGIAPRDQLRPCALPRGPTPRWGQTTRVRPRW